MAGTIDEYKRLFKEATVADQTKLFQLLYCNILGCEPSLASTKHDGHHIHHACLGHLLLSSWMGYFGDCSLLVLCSRCREALHAQRRGSGIKDQIGPASYWHIADEVSTFF